MYAIISDIHSNFDALVAVLEDISKKGISQIYCLGDVVGYGPEPRKCLEEVSKVCEVVLKGNHDEAALSAPIGFNPYARAAIEWTKKELDPVNHPEDPEVAELWKYLEGLPLTHERKEDSILFVHASPRDPLMEYILEKDAQSPPGGKLDQIFEALSQNIAFVGHSHVPGIFFESRRYTPAIAEEFFPFPKDEKCIFNVGSVGQPRDYDFRACWVEVHPDGVIYHRVVYDAYKTFQKVKQTGKLHESLGTRLLIGV